MLINGNYVVCMCIGEDRGCFQHLAINKRLTVGGGAGGGGGVHS